MRTLALLLGALSAFGSLSIDMYRPSFPSIMRDLTASEAQAQLTLAVFFAGLGLGQAFYGPISDRHGRRRPRAIHRGARAVSRLSPSIAWRVDALTAPPYPQVRGYR